MQNLEGVENTFKKTVEIAEKQPPIKGDKITSVFMWQNNLLKFYMQNDIKKAIDYSLELDRLVGEKLQIRDLCDLKFSIATSYVLEGSPEHLDKAKSLYKDSLRDNEPFFQGFVYNNLGMTNFYDFVIRSTELGNPESAGIEALQPIIECFEESIFNLKKSIHLFEDFSKRFEAIKDDKDLL